MAENIIPNSEFVICVLKPDSRNKKHVIIHPVLLICNDDPDKRVSPEIVIAGFKMLGSFQNSKMISISKTQVSERNWNLLKEGLRDSEICNAGVKIGTEIVYA